MLFSSNCIMSSFDSSPDHRPISSECKYTTQHELGYTSEHEPGSGGTTLNHQEAHPAPLSANAPVPHRPPTPEHVAPSAIVSPPSPHPDEFEPPEVGNLGALDVFALTVNKMIGTGIFIYPTTVLILTGSREMAMSFWVIGVIYTFLK